MPSSSFKDSLLFYLTFQVPRRRSLLSTCCLIIVSHIWKMIRFVYRLITRTTEIHRLSTKALLGSKGDAVDVLLGRAVMGESMRLGVWRIWMMIRLSNTFAGDLNFEKVGRNQIYSVSRQLAKVKGIPLESLEFLFLNHAIGTIRRVEIFKQTTRGLCDVQVTLMIHKESFIEMWQALLPDLEKKEKNYIMVGTNILDFKCFNSIQLGFQGSDPSTDFRAMGVLALTLIHRFSVSRVGLARHILQTSNSTSLTCDQDEPWYSFGLAGIHITAFIVSLLDSGGLDRLLVMGYDDLDGILNDLFGNLFYFGQG
ncbi:ELMO domain-containing protein B [Neolecta irregularis DAH-3]|uniref:ELMO domain-containing protein B n=1 Tax=Neolecta irregularis (strain DAH-3) TaxID=1198029 RepID=A0A1U7LND8_NEOID|nr:ELMO domain-containing protein B [Neolecta irregularis DAH-3]|eukprot:OLL24149.1 ELMO domain-containing protein B [Neolecta irregularis DAH-3]